MVDEYGHCHGECPEAKGAMDRAEAAEAALEEARQGQTNAWKKAAEAAAAAIAAREERDRLRAALEYVRDNEGRVCAEFDLCDHAACQSSVAAWFAADTALRDRWDEFMAQGGRQQIPGGNSRLVRSQGSPGGSEQTNPGWKPAALSNPTATTEEEP